MTALSNKQEESEGVGNFEQQPRGDNHKMIIAGIPKNHLGPMHHIAHNDPQN